jgi:hypothetical protein
MQLKEKNNLFYEILKKDGFCSFNQFEKQLQLEENRKFFISTPNSQFEDHEDLFRENDFQVNFAFVVQECFDQEIRIVDRLNLDQIVRNWKRNELGEIFNPIRTSYQKVDLKYDFISKSQKPSVCDCINFEINQMENRNSEKTINVV